jgi:glyoxylase-like metal-dependent hydrolase (beta-lactamase superfamily II)
MLEDHVGDVVRKARLMQGTTAETAAQTARMSTKDWKRFEEEGQPLPQDWSALASLLILDAAKLHALANGWTPNPLDLSRWPGFQCLVSQGNGMSVNGYLVADLEAREAVLIDTGFDASAVIRALEAQSLRLVHLGVTHSHHDHMAALGDLRLRYPDVQVHTASAGAPASQRLQEGDQFRAGRWTVRWMPTPGHADDGVTFLVSGWPGEVPALAMVGDALFAGSMGGAPGKGTLARERVRDCILSLPGDTVICPGHGPLTTVSEQWRANPFFLGRREDDPAFGQ